jgi:antitoxin HigA-1
MATEDDVFLAPADGFAVELVHAGKVLQHELAARGLTANALALKLRVPVNRLTEVSTASAESRLTPPCASATPLSPSAAFWLSLRQYDLSRTEKRFGAKIRTEVESGA